LSGWRRLSIVSVIGAVLTATGIVGYMIIEGFSFFDALYQTITTITTAGFGETEPLSTKGRAFTLALICVGVVLILVLLGTVMEIIVEGELSAVLGVRKMKSKIESLRNHYILCGFGRVGEEIGREFKERRILFVVVESNPEAIERAKERGFLIIEGDATQDSTLFEAGIGRARCLLAASDSDAGNTYIVLTAKAVRPDIMVVARAGHPENQAKMLRAGADRVISPYLIGGRRMALSALQPLVVDFVDTLVGVSGPGEHVLAEVEATSESSLAGRALEDVLKRTQKATVLAIQKPDGSVAVGPDRSTILREGDRLIVLAPEADVEALGTPFRS